jgi:hemerythrin superfamily protein
MDKTLVPYQDAVDLLDADHKAVKQMFIDFAALSEDKAPAKDRRALALRICDALTVHAQIEEEIFYPQVREAVGEGLIEEALGEHAGAKALIAQIKGMGASDARLDATVKKLGKAIDEHVLEEREEIFLIARNAPLDLRGMAVELFARKKQLKNEAPVAAKEPA